MMVKVFKAIVLVIILNIIPLIFFAYASSYEKELTLKIKYPYDGTRILRSPMPVYGVVSDPSAQIDINGTPVVIAESGYFQGSVDLVKGENKIIITAKTQAPEIKITTITVNYSPNW